jgi:ABC-type branched-subunit amino acid transport system permease subunit
MIGSTFSTPGRVWPLPSSLCRPVDLGRGAGLTPEQSQMLVFVLVGIALMLLVIFRPQGILGSKKELTFVR